jgi:predicted nucleotidyltransferase
MADIAQLCQRWKIRELALFGSQARGDARQDSDVDFLVSFDPDNDWDLFDLGEMRSDFSELLGQKTDLVQLDTIRNPHRREFMLRDMRVIYEAG